MAREGWTSAGNSSAGYLHIIMDRCIMVLFMGFGCL